MSVVCLAKKISLAQPGTYLLFGALCPAEVLSQLENNLRTMEDMPLTGTTDPYGIDLWLAKTAETVCPPGTLAAALSVNAWAEGPVSGGVIGAPHEDPVSADEALEELPGGLWCWSRPESPGFVLCGSRKDAVGARDALCVALEQRADPWNAFSAWLEKNSQVRTYLFLLDGCGQQGMLAAGDENETICLRL